MSELIQEKSHIGVQKIIVLNPLKLQEIYRNISELIQVQYWCEQICLGQRSPSGGPRGPKGWRLWSRQSLPAERGLGEGVSERVSGNHQVSFELKFHAICYFHRCASFQDEDHNFVRFSNGFLSQIKVNSSPRPAVTWWSMRSERFKTTALDHQLSVSKRDYLSNRIIYLGLHTYLVAQLRPESKIPSCFSTQYCFSCIRVLLKKKCLSPYRPHRKKSLLFPCDHLSFP